MIIFFFPRNEYSTKERLLLQFTVILKKSLCQHEQKEENVVSSSACVLEKIHKPRNPNKTAIYFYSTEVRFVKGH